YWFFFGKKTSFAEATERNGNLEIIVEGGYKPENIKLNKGEKVELTFIRKDPSSCLEEIVIPDFKIKKYLPMNKPVTIEIKPKESGEYRFQCGMNMYHGKLLVN